MRLYPTYYTLSCKRYVENVRHTLYLAEKPKVYLSLTH
nr:MAG TPA: hypothetical protein [Caudoviricetes sp.]DAQ69192.1 MAG TPA: hypothetical protein [Caudoviricetes sp.]DAW00201.1 MAG TPA: hypothetical protein [Caudoviricetes sp.]